MAATLRQSSRSEQDSAVLRSSPETPEYEEARRL